MAKPAIRHERRHLDATIYKRDRGVCALCGLDTVAARERWANTWPPHLRSGFWTDLGYPNWFRPERRPWEADHIRPVCEGGTSDLTNFRTLCIPCHSRESVALAKRRARGGRG